eukprot:m.342238 g.342238  ORF g.342238 m.342238 type:complete len:69 (-) comp16121_c0_seq13:513-719(-)
MSYSTYYQSSNMSNDNCDCDGIYANAEEALGTAENIVGRTYNTDIRLDKHSQDSFTFIHLRRSASNVW